MVIATFLFLTMLPFLALAIFVCVGCCVLLRRKPAAMETPFRAAGPRAGFDILPCPSSLVTAPPLTRPTPPSGHSSPDVVWAMGRGMNDFKSARSVEVTIDRDKVWLEVDGVNVFRAYNVGIVQVDDRRIVDA